MTEAQRRRQEQLDRQKIVFVKCENFVRICVTSRSMRWFMDSLQPNCPFPMKVVKTVKGGDKLEREIEKLFCQYRHDKRWFRYEGGLKKWLEARNT